MATLTVGELRAALASLPDDAEVHFGAGFDPEDCDGYSLAPKWCVETAGRGLKVYADSEDDIPSAVERHKMGDEFRIARVLMIDEEPFWDDEDD